MGRVDCWSTTNDVNKIKRTRSGEGQAGIGRATVPTCPGDNNTLLVYNDHVVAVQMDSNVPDPAASVKLVNVCIYCG